MLASLNWNGRGRLAQVLAAIFAFAWCASPSQALAAPGHIAASLLASTERPLPGQTFTVGLRLVPDGGWHGYWSNPGDSGLAPTVTWQAPNGLTFGALQHPAPTLLNVMGITSYVHAGQHILLSRVHLDRNVPAGTKLPITAKVTWLACSASLCVPGRATLQLSLTAGDGARSADAASLEQARRQLPRAASGGGFFVDRGSVHLRLPPNLTLGGKPVFFPDSNGVFDVASAHAQNFGGGTEIIVPAPRRLPKSISGVVSDGRNSYRLALPQIAVPASAKSSSTESARPNAKANAAKTAASITTKPTPQPIDRPAAGPTGAAHASLWLTLVAAVVGGFLLNLMPCVFPVLSLKAIALARTGSSQADARRDALAYTAGAVLACAGLGLVIMLLRMTGDEVGWSFQLQDPGITLTLLLLATAITLNLAGLFELPGISFAGAPSRPRGSWNSAAAGALTAFVATPCSGPFMAAALGATLVLPPIMSLIVYAGLGLGLALPMLLIAFMPGLRRALPRPGPWMATFRRWMALPTALAALALLWLLSRQVSAASLGEGLTLLILFGLALWWFGRGQRNSRPQPWLGLAPAAAALAGLALIWPAPVAVAAMATAANVEPFSEARLAQLRQQHVSVFVDISADWCLTCKINERVAIDRQATHDAFQKAGIVTLRGDWTNGDPAITRFLARYQRNSIPFYLFYSAEGTPAVLPQLLTVGALQKLAADSSEKSPFSKPGDA